MKRFLIFLAVGVALIVVLLMVQRIQRKSEKSLSPEEAVNYTDGNLKVQVLYNRPSKRGRKIFGELVPYGKVWRTGANEATTFETNKTLTMGGETLMPGKYTLWTIPDSTVWTVIFNSQYGQWGINHEGEADRDPARDVLRIPAYAVIQDRTFEQFTIAFEKMGGQAEMVLLWDNTVV
ncbi:MAG TPA: DUF2911 domain-containing protein, partial [Cyclobacteriaceae bacterium]|nr:DUF2911 domain-containing protein [Cyclobacteriaceae bacterium]